MSPTFNPFGRADNDLDEADTLDVGSPTEEPLHEIPVDQIYTTRFTQLKRSTVVRYLTGRANGYAYELAFIKGSHHGSLRGLGRGNSMWWEGCMYLPMRHPLYGLSAADLTEQRDDYQFMLQKVPRCCEFVSREDVLRFGLGKSGTRWKIGFLFDDADHHVALPEVLSFLSGFTATMADVMRQHLVRKSRKAMKWGAW